MVTSRLIKLGPVTSDKTINRGQPCVYSCEKIQYVGCRSCIPCPSSVEYENITNTPCTKKCQNIQSVESGHCKEKEDMSSRQKCLVS